MHLKSAACVAFACLSVRAFGAVAPQLPPSEYPDTEVSTNLVLEQRVIGMVGLNFRLEFNGSPSNNVEVALGTDADRDGTLSFDETGIRVGWDCGRYFVERVATGERFEESVVGTNGTPRVLDWNCTLRLRRMKSLCVSNEIAAAFLSMTTNAPSWLYADEWDLMRLTARGTDIPDERFEYTVTQRGHVIFLR